MVVHDFALIFDKYEFNVMPFGLANAVATFCALMDKLFAGCQWDFILCFIDDILVFMPEGLDLHLQQLEAVYSTSSTSKYALYNW